MNTLVNILSIHAQIRSSFGRFRHALSAGWLDMTEEPVLVSFRTRRRLLPIADARHVVRGFCLTGLAHDRNEGGQFVVVPQRSRPAGGSPIRASVGHAAHQCPDCYVWIIGRRD